MTTQYGPDYVRQIAPYIAGKPISEVAREFGLDEARIVKLASNENPLGMPESAKAAMAAAISGRAGPLPSVLSAPSGGSERSERGGCPSGAGPLPSVLSAPSGGSERSERGGCPILELGRYPDSNAFELKGALSQRYDVPADWITLGNGSNDILELAAHAFVERGQSIVYSQYSFAVYALATQGLGARAIVTPAVKYGHDLDAMLRAIAADTRLVFIANPNNPTGTFIEGPALEAFLEKVPKSVVVVLDEAYTEYLPAEKRYDSIAWVRRYPNLLVSRTFSKAYGLAGLRVGLAIAQPQLTDLMNRLRQPFNVNTIAQAAAVAALDDHTFIEKSAALNAAGYRRLTAAFDKLGLEYVPSFGNFVLVRVGDDDGAGTRVNLALLKLGVIVRPVGNYGLPQWLRVTIGLPEENEAFIAALEKALATG